MINDYDQMSRRLRQTQKFRTEKKMRLEVAVAGVGSGVRSPGQVRKRRISKTLEPGIRNQESESGSRIQ